MTTTNAAALKAAEEITTRLDGMVDGRTQEIAAIIAKYFPAPVVEGVNRKLLEALEFYADPGTYHACGFIFDPPTGGFDDDFDSGHEDYDRPMPGKVAREALATAESASVSMESELAEALRAYYENEGYETRSSAAKILARYDTAKAKRRAKL